MEKISFKTLDTSVDNVIETSLQGLLRFETPEYYIDKGGVGEVFALPSGFCMKLIEDRHNSPNRHLFNLGNTPYQEMRFQERMSQTNFSGKTRVPKIVGASTSTLRNGKFVLVMERLPAVNLQHIINRNAELPPSFNIDDFFTDLEKFINHMQQSDAISHQDLYARNIMVDTESGTPYVIDFGRAIDLSNIKDPKKRNHIEDHDWERLDETYNLIRSLQN